jgi:hypothetical protein
LHFFVAPHPGWEARERREIELRSPEATEYVVADARRIGPVGFDGDELEPAACDELARKTRSHPVKLARSVRRLAEQNQARIADPLDERVDRRGIDIVDWLGCFADECREGGGSARPSQFLNDLRVSAPCLLADEGDEPNVGQRLLAVFGLTLACDPQQDLR